MKRPEKRKLTKDAPYAYLQYDKGYNHCWYEWEKYLPSEEEILNIMLEIAKKKGNEQIEEVEKKGLWDAP
ncbi:MAG TPA: hypothetical protein ENH85_12575, partial [Candidatus Scalindua sp.]|nr:hypothetical protein [Candidatus Scalindua sp.]